MKNTRKKKSDKNDINDGNYRVVHKVSDENYSSSIANRDVVEIDNKTSVKDFDNAYKERYFGEKDINWFSKNTLIIVSLVVILLICLILFVKFFKNEKIA